MSLIGLQNICHREAIDLIIQELNNPTIPLIKDWSNDQQKKWNYVMSNHVDQSHDEYLGFIYDETVGIEMNEVLSSPSINIHDRYPFCVSFRVNKNFHFVVVNMHVDFKETDDKQSMTNFIGMIDKSYGKFEINICF